MLARSDVVSLFLHEDREGLFLGAVQDVCLLVLHRHEENRRPSRRAYEAALIDGGGKRSVLGKFTLPMNGQPWTLPVPTKNDASHPIALASPHAKRLTLHDYGYRVRVGKVVPTREHASLRTEPDRTTLPLIWASAVRPDGSFCATGGKRSKTPLWFSPPTKKIAYATKAACVIVQRTSNRAQRRRLNAAAVAPSFLQKNRRYGFVAENHVIVLEAVAKRPDVTPALLARILNSEIVNERFSAVCGSFSVSARLLARLALPDPAALPREVDRKFSSKLAACFAEIDGVLAPCDGTNRAKNPVHEARDVCRRLAINDHARLKTSRLARPQKIG